MCEQDAHTTAGGTPALPKPTSQFLVSVGWLNASLLLLNAIMKIHIPTPLRQYAGKNSTVDVKGSTVAEALANLTTQYGDLRRHLYTDDGKLRAFVNVYVNDEDIRYLQKENTPTKEGDSISIVPSIAGGCFRPLRLNRFG